MKIGYTVETVFLFAESPEEEYHVEKPYWCLTMHEAYTKANELRDTYMKTLGNPYPIYAFNRYCGNGTVKFIKIRLSKFGKCFLEQVICQ